MKNLLFVILLFFCKGCVAQTVSKVPEITILFEIKSPVKRDVKFSIKNESDTLQYYYIGLEAEIDNQWREVILDVNKDGDPRSARILKIYPKEVSSIYSNTNEKIKNVEKSLTHFRFKINYGSTIDSLTGNIYSAPFNVKR